MRHKKKLERKRAKREFKLREEEVGDRHHRRHTHDYDLVDTEPDFATYAEYKAWKAEQKELKHEDKELLKEQKHQYHSMFHHIHEKEHGSLIPRFSFDAELRQAR